MDYNIGCSGYYYPNWKNKFYPEGMPPRKWLEHYATVFNTVELNGTFYRLPKVADLKKYASLTPPEFTFAVKVNRYITHIQRLKEKQPILDFQQLIRDGLGEKVTRLLFQMPPSFHYSEENLDRIITSVPSASENVIEFRHISWWNEKTKDALTAASLTFCNVDFPGLASFMIHTSPYSYFRFHGNPELFISSYSPDRLQEVFNQLPKTALAANIYFNNTMYDGGYTNARQFKALADTTKGRSTIL